MTFKPWDDGLGTGKGIESSNHENMLLGVSPAVLVTSDLIDVVWLWFWESNFKLSQVMRLAQQPPLPIKPAQYP